MGGGSPSGGTQTTTQVQKPEMPQYMENLLNQTGQNIQKVQNMLPLWGTTGYGEYQTNPAYTAWQQAGGGGYGAGYEDPYLAWAYDPFQYEHPTNQFATNMAQHMVWNPMGVGGGQQAQQGYLGGEGNIMPGMQPTPHVGWPVEGQYAKGNVYPGYTVDNSQGTWAVDQDGNWRRIRDAYGAPVGGFGYGGMGEAPPQFIGVPGTEYQATPNFLGANPQQIAELSPLELWGMAMTPGTWNRPEAEQMAMDYATQAGGPAPSNVPYYQEGAFEASPYYQTAQGAFESGVAPMIENQMALSGLGTSSSLADALSLGWGQQLPQVLSQYSTQYVEPQLAREMQQRQMLISMIPQLAGLGAQETQREMQAINAAMQTGGVERGVRQAGFDAEYADFLRRQALAEQALFGPMGMLPSAVGSRMTGTTTTETSGGGGMFK